MKKCKYCKKSFKPKYNTLERHCWSQTCLTMEAMSKVQEAKDMRAKKSKELIKTWKSDLETTQQLLKKAQSIFNSYVRLRDFGKNCISCDKLLEGKFDAGHYFSSGGHKSVTLDERNVHGQCVYCNRYLHGNLINYQIGLVNRIGEEMFSLMDEAQKTKKFTRSELKEIIETYKEKCKLLKLNSYL